MTLHQSRIDACKGTMYWDEYRSDSFMYEVVAHDVQEYCSTGTCTPRLLEIDGFEPPSYAHSPPVQCSEEKVYDLCDDTAFNSENGRLLNLLVQVAEWLALARGFPAVHLSLIFSACSPSTVWMLPMQPRFGSASFWLICAFPMIATTQPVTGFIRFSATRLPSTRFFT